MPQDFLDRFRSKVPEVQGRQILAILREKRDKGELQSIEEFRAELNSLTEQLISETIMPTLKLFFGDAGHIISSETYNFMVKRIKDDLDTAFTEANNIDEILDAHQRIVNEVVLRTIQYGINELDEQITLLEFLAGNSRGFDVAQNNTFATTKNISTPRGSKLSTILYAGTNVEDDADVDTIGERLRIGPTGGEDAPIQEVVHLFDSASTASNLNTNPETSDINHISDGTPGTYWIYDSMLTEPVAGGVVHKILVDLAATQDVNYIRIEPASPHPMVLEAVSYLDNAGNEQSISVAETLITKPLKIEFGRATARVLILQFRQKNYEEVQFEQAYVDTNFYRIVRVGGPLFNQPFSPLPLSSHLRRTVRSPLLIDVLGFPQTPLPLPKVKRYVYTVGFDNIRPGLSEFRRRGIWVSKPLEVEKPGLIGLRVSETRAGSTTVAGSITIDKDNFDPDRFYHGSIEYSIVKENLNASGQSINVERFNILPLGQNQVVHERLDLVEKSPGSSENDIGYLRFYPDSTEPKVYRDGTLLVKDTDWEYDTAVTDLFDQEDPENAVSMVKSIRILDSTFDVYTVTYTPAIGNSHVRPQDFSSLINVISLGDAGRIRLSTNNLIFTDLEKAGQTVAKSNIYLIILLRRNSAELAQSPTVEEYLLVSGQGVSGKFDN